MNRKTLKEVLDSDLQCYYAQSYVIEYCDETDSIYLEDASEVNFDDIDWDFFFKYELTHETYFPDDIREIIKVLKRQPKEYQKFENGKDFVSVCDTQSNVIYTEEQSEELYDLNCLQTELTIKSFERIKD